MDFLLSAVLKKNAADSSLKMSPQETSVSEELAFARIDNLLRSGKYNKRVFEKTRVQIGRASLTADLKRLHRF